MKNKLQEVREKIIKANPSIMELKFGCRVNYQGEDYRVIRGGFMTDIHQGCIGGAIISRPLNTSDSEEIEIFKNYKNLEILGRPITLSDVLMVFRKQEKELEDLIDWRIREIKLETLNENKKIIVDSWNLKKNDIEKQSKKIWCLIDEIL